MLIEFRVKNYRSFRDEQVFSMVASSDSDLLQNTFDPSVVPNRKRLLTAAAIFGANASGKSNLISAFSFLRRIVTTSDQRRKDVSIRTEPFLLDTESKENLTSFDIHFIYDGIRYRYYLAVDNERIREEELVAYPKGVAQLWYARSATPKWKPDFSIAGIGWKFGTHLKGELRTVAISTRPTVSFLTIAERFGNQQLTQVYNWFEQKLNLLDVSQGSGQEMLTALITRDNDVMRARLVALLRDADFGIHDFEMREEEFVEQEIPEDAPEAFRQIVTEIQRQMKEFGAKSTSLYMLHNSNLLDSVVPLPLASESFGTVKFFERSGPILHALEHGQILVVDELDASLHPLLVRKLVQLFQDPKLNQKGAQLIFNTHDVTLMDSNSNLRRDQFWLVEKERSGASTLYSLWDFEAPRKGEALQKNYMAGRYGATPNIDELLPSAV